MKWIAKRIFLASHGFMDIALSQFVDPFIELMIREEGITTWYCSRKTEKDGTRPSVRIYLYVSEAKEPETLSKLFAFIKGKKSVIGWTEEYGEPALPDPAKPNLKLIQQGCEIALSLMKQYPDPNRHENRQFKTNLRKELALLVRSMNLKIDLEAIHFIANNLGLKDQYLLQLFAAKETS